MEAFTVCKMVSGEDYGEADGAVMIMTNFRSVDVIDV